MKYSSFVLRHMTLRITHYASRISPYALRVALVSVTLLLATAATLVFAPRIDDAHLVTVAPEGGSVAPDSVISVTFSRAVERRSTEQAFLMFPIVRGRFAWADDRTLTFAPAVPLASQTLYRVTMRAGLRDTRGRVNRTETSWVFRVR